MRDVEVDVKANSEYEYSYAYRAVKEFVKVIPQYLHSLTILPIYNKFWWSYEKAVFIAF